jgi:hypothetical protein
MAGDRSMVQRAQNTASAAHQRLSRRKYLLLTLSLVLLLVLYPYIGTITQVNAILKILTSVILIAAVYAVRERRGTFLIALVLGVLAFTAGWFSLLLSAEEVQTVESIINPIFFAFTTVAVLRSIIRGKVTEDVIYGAIAVYLLLGLTWGSAYTYLESTHPGSFQVAHTTETGGQTGFSDLLYYSFVTLTTTGYGDIVPLTSQARSLAFLEAVSGVLFMAVFISRLIGALSSSRYTTCKEGEEERAEKETDR